MDKKNTNLDELLKVIAASGAGIPIAGIRVVVEKVDEEEPVSHEPVSLEADEEACDCGHGKSCDHNGSCNCRTNKSSDCCDEDDDPIDFDEMLRFIRRRTGMCERTVLAFLAAQIEYLDSMIDEEDEV